MAEIMTERVYGNSSDVLIAYPACNATWLILFQAELLTGLSVKTIDDAEKAVLMILERGAGKAVITLGGKGSVIGTQENRMPRHIPVTAAEPVDTTVTHMFGFLY